MVNGKHETARTAASPAAGGRRAVANPAFDVTPNRFVTAIITERVHCRPDALRCALPEEDHG